jgi:biotin operon repressor
MPMARSDAQFEELALVNKVSIDKIKSATPFLIWFRRCLPESQQAQVRPFLDRPYQLALTILDCCEAAEPLPVKDIAQAIGMSPHTVKQVLLALKDGGMTFTVSPTKNWQLSQAELPTPTSFESSLLATVSTATSGHSPA